jgi:hypothetical protein
MATLAVDVQEFNRMQCRRAVWTGLATGDDGEAIDWSAFADKSVQVIGTFGGATVTLQGSNDEGPVPTNWVALTDLLGNALNFTATGLEQVTENTCWVRPVVTGGAASGITVQMLLRRT